MRFPHISNFQASYQLKDIRVIVITCNEAECKLQSWRETEILLADMITALQVCSYSEVATTELNFSLSFLFFLDICHHPEALKILWGFKGPSLGGRWDGVLSADIAEYMKKIYHGKVQFNV